MPVGPIVSTWMILGSDVPQADFRNWAQSVEDVFGSSGGNTQTKVDKDLVAGTASVLFRTGLSGRAEIGLIGDDKLSVRVSANGSTWQNAMVVDQSSSYIGFGTTAPVAKIHAVDPIPVCIERFGGGAPQFQIRRANGTESAPTTVINGDSFGNFTFQAYNGTSYATHARLRVDVDGAVVSGIVPSKMMLMTMSAAGVFASRWETRATGDFLPGNDNLYDIGSAALRVNDIFLANAPTVSSDARGKDVEGAIPFAGSMVDAVEPKLYRFKEGRCDTVESETEFDVELEQATEWVELPVETVEVVGENAVKRTEMRRVERPVVSWHPITDEAGEPILDDAGRPRMHAEPVMRETRVPRIETVARPGQRLHAGFIAQEVKAAMTAAGADFAAWGLADKNDPNSRQWVRGEELVAVLWAALRETRAEVARLKDELEALAQNVQN